MSVRRVNRNRMRRTGMSGKQRGAVGRRTGMSAAVGLGGVSRVWQCMGGGMWLTPVAAGTAGSVQHQQKW